MLWDIPSQHTAAQDLSSKQEFHGPARLRNALVNDYFGAAGSTLNQLGVENVWQITSQLGLQSPEAPKSQDYSAHNLFRPFNLLEISHALSVFSNKGFLSGQIIDNIDRSTNGKTTNYSSQLPPQPSMLLGVTSIDGAMILDWNQPQSKSIVTPQLAYLMTDILSDQTARWPSLGHPNALEIDRPAAGKYSKTSDGYNNWVFGYTNDIFVGVWLGQSNPAQELAQDDSIRLREASTGLWHAVAQYSSQNQPYEDFSIPSGISFVEVCDPSGLLPTAACPNVVEEVFLEGSEPVTIDTLYRLAAINRNTGRLATVFTPPDQVEQRTYLVVPEGAEQWMELNNIENQPENYDPLPNNTVQSNDAIILSPGSFQSLSGNVPIFGTAAGSDFSFYRIQYGAGLNPSSWILLGGDNPSPVVNGKLIDWDTSNLDGLYAVQLLVVQKDRKLERSTIIVTIDNQAPSVEILNPNNDEIISLTSAAK